MSSAANSRTQTAAPEVTATAKADKGPDELDVPSFLRRRTQPRDRGFFR